MIDGGGLGRPLLVRATEIHNGPFHADWFWDAEAEGGGAVIGMGIHGLYVAEWLMGARAVRVYAELGTLKWTEHCKNGAEDSAFITLRFESGLLAYSQAGYGPPIEVEAALRPHVSTNVGWRFPTADAWHQHGHACVVRHFLDLVGNGAAPQSTLAEGRRALELVAAVYRSARGGGGGVGLAASGRGLLARSSPSSPRRLQARPNPTTVVLVTAACQDHRSRATDQVDAVAIPTRGGTGGNSSWPSSHFTGHASSEASCPRFMRVHPSRGAQHPRTLPVTAIVRSRVT